MKTKSTFFLLAFIVSGFMAQAQVPEVIYAQFGPPAAPSVWEHYSIPLTHESFGIDSLIFDQVLAQVGSIWFRTEMHSGPDTAGLDIVQIGTSYYSDFNTSSESWSSGGDATMEWFPTGGYEGGYLQIADWATGVWSYLIAPATWSGDWTALKGQNIEFWYMTDQPSYEGEIEIRTGEIDRLVINTPLYNTILPDDSVFIELDIMPAPDDDITVSFYSSNTACIRVPEPITIPAGSSSAYVYFHAADGATVGCESVIEATSNGYITSRITMRVLDNFGIEEENLSEVISVYPNPTNGKFTLSNTSDKNIQQLMMYDLSGGAILDLNGSDLSNTEIDVSGNPAGIYFLRLFVDGQVLTSKVIIE